MPAPIEDYALIGDLQSAALVSRDGSIDWLCLPRFDSPACFAALLHDESAGRWRLAPADPSATVTRKYRADTLILETEWETAEGRVKVIDCMPPRGEAADLVRVVQGISGTVTMRMHLKIRFDYGHIVPWVRHSGSDLGAVAGPDAVWLRSGVHLHGAGFATHADFTVSAGERVPFVLTYQQSHLPVPVPVDAEQAIADTQEFWTDWIKQSTYTGKWSEEVKRSLILLKALTYAPTGGLVAAATTSLPEQPGGSRNWDYRYCWLRDSTFTLQALISTGFLDEAKAWRDWLLRAVAGDPAELQIMYGLHGSRRLPEYELEWLNGYGGARPVRVGNAASGQLQLDVWGEVLDTLHLGRSAGINDSQPAWDVQKALLDYLEGAWHLPDNSLWEVRGQRQHFVHSQMMAWAGFDRAVRTVREHGLDGPVDRWAAIRDRIHAEVCRFGFDSQRNTFTQFYGSSGLDAALLLIPRVGFLPWNDPRVVGTVEAIQRELCHNGFVLRYEPQKENVDGLPGTEGAFLACSFWLADALHGIGRVQEARDLFDKLLRMRNDVGLLSEEVDTTTFAHLGNTPQAYSLVGLINTALRLESDQA